jgi:hypothetical protein
MAQIEIGFVECFERIGDELTHQLSLEKPGSMTRRAREKWAKVYFGQSDFLRVGRHPGIACDCLVEGLSDVENDFLELIEKSETVIEAERRIRTSSRMLSSDCDFR